MPSYMLVQNDGSLYTASRPLGASRNTLIQHWRPLVPYHRTTCSSASAFCGSSSRLASRPACLQRRHSCCLAPNSSCVRPSHSAALPPSSGQHSISSCLADGRLPWGCSSTSTNNSSGRSASDVRTAAAAAAACPFPDAAGPHHRHQRRSSSSSSSSFAEQLHPDLCYQLEPQGFAGSDSFLGLGFRHSVEEAFKAFVHVPAGSSRQQHDEQQQQQQSQQHNSAAAVPERVNSSSNTSTSAVASPAAGSAHALMRQIQGCKCAADVELLLQQHWKQLDHIHVAAAYVQLVRVQRNSSKQSHSSSSSSSSRELMSPASMQWLQQLAAHHLPQMQSRHLANIIWACASLELNSSQPWLQTITDKAQTLFYKGTTPQGFANIIWGVATLRAQVSPEWVGDFLGASQPHLCNFQAQELSSTIWALARLGVQPPASWHNSFVAASTAKMGSCNAQGLSNQLWAVAKLGLVMPEPWMAAITYASQFRAHEFTPLGLSNLLWGAARLAGKHQQLQQYSAAAAEWAQPQQQQQSQQQQQAAVPLYSSNTQWIHPLLTAAAPKLQQHNAHTLSNVVWSLAVLDHRSDQQFLDQCLQQLMSKVDQLSAAGAAAALWGFSKLGVLPSPQQLAPLLQQLQLVLPHSNAQQLIYLAAALALFKQQQQEQQGGSVRSSDPVFSETLLQQYLAVCSEQLQQQRFGPGQICQLGRWLAAAAVQPGPQWTDNYLLHLAQQLTRLNPSHHVVILKTLASWGLKPHDGWSAMFLAAVAAEQRVSRYSAGHIGALLLGLSAAALQPQQQQLEMLLRQLLTDTAQATSQSTAAVLQGLCGLGFRPSQHWLQRFWEVGEASLQGSDAAGITALAVALQLPELGQLQIRPSKLWGLAYHAAVAAVLNPDSSTAAANPGLEPQQAAAVLTALAAVQRPPKDDALLLDLMAAAAASDRIQQLSLQELVGSWWALVVFGVLAEPVPLNRVYQQQQQQQQQPQAQQTQQVLQQPVQLPHQQQQNQQVFYAAQQQHAGQAAYQQHHPHLQQQQLQQQQSLLLQQQEQQQQQQLDMQQWQVHWLQQLFLRPGVEFQLKQLSVVSLLQLADALGRLQQPTPGTWAHSYAAAVSVHIPQLAPHQLIAVLCAVPSLGGYTAQPVLTDQILAVLQPNLGKLSPKQLSEVIAVVQQSGARPSEPWLSDFMSACEACLPKFLGRQVTRVLASLARMRFIPGPDFLSAAADLAVEKAGSGVPSSSLVDLIWALTALRVDPTPAWMARFEARMLQKGIDRLDAHSISRFGWCLGALQRKPGQLLMAKYLAAAQQQLCSMNANSLADTIWSCAMLDEKPSKQWLDCFIAESRKHLATAPSSALVTVMWALALLQHRPPSDWMHRCLAAITACLSRSHAAATAATAAVAPRVAAVGGSSSSIQLLQRPQLPGALAAAVGPATPPQLAPLTPSQVTNLVWSLAALDCQLPDQLMQLLTWQAECVISAVDSDDLAQLVWALDRLDDTTDKVWVRKFAATARAQLLAATSGALAQGAAGLRVLPQQQGFVSPAAAAAAAGFKQLHGVSGMGQVVMIRPSRSSAGVAAAGQVQQQSTGIATPSASTIAALPSIAKGVTRTKISKQELHAKLMQLQQLVQQAQQPQ